MAKRYKGLSKFGMALAELMNEYTKEVDKAIQNGVPEAAEAFRKTAEDTCRVERVIDDEAAMKSPYGYYKDNWFVKQETTSKYHKYVGNAKTVPSRKNGDIPLINILEYSTTRGHPHVDHAIMYSKDKILNIFMKHLERGA